MFYALYLPMTQSVQILNIILVLCRDSIGSTMKAILYNFHHVWRWTGNPHQRILSVVLYDLLREQTLQDERQQQDDVTHVRCSNFRWKFWLLRRCLCVARTRQSWIPCSLHILLNCRIMNVLHVQSKLHNLHNLHIWFKPHFVQTLHNSHILTLTVGPVCPARIFLNLASSLVEFWIRFLNLASSLDPKYPKYSQHNKKRRAG